MGNNYQEIDVSELLIRISTDDKKAFEKIYRIYIGPLTNYIKPFVKNSQDETEEILQDIFLKVWTYRKKVSQASNFRAYLFQMAKHELIDRHARTLRYNTLLESKVFTPIEIDTETSLEKIVFKEHMNLANNAIEGLSPQRKTIFKMRMQDDLSISEIATHLDITKGAVKKQLYEARDIVKEQIIQNLKINSF